MDDEDTLHPCRALLRRWLDLQGETPARDRRYQAALFAARKRLQRRRRGHVADERSCHWALGGLYRAIVGTTWEDPSAEPTAPLWGCLWHLVSRVPPPGVLAGLED